MNQSQQEFLKMVERGDKIAMLFAPSFIVDFDYPAIVGMSKALGAGLVSEITYGCHLVNTHYNHYIKTHKNQKYFINTTCPTIVNLIRTQFPDLEKYLLPDISCALSFIDFYNLLHPDYKLVFISPCVAKRSFETPRLPEWSLTLTFSELRELFIAKNIKAEDYQNSNEQWDKFSRIDTKLYPLDGGLSATARWQDFFPDLKIFIGSGLKNLLPILMQMKQGNYDKNLLDICACEGSCVGGPCVFNKDLPLVKKRQKVIDYYKLFADNS